MKKLLAISASLVLVSTQWGCVSEKAPITTPAPNQEVNQGASDNDAAQQNAISHFDVKLLVQNEDQSFDPVTPEDLKELKFQGKMVDLASILLPGDADAAKLDTSESARKAELDKVTQGQSVFVYNGNGVYSVFTPKADQNMSLDIQLKGDSNSYRVVRVNNMTKGTFVFKDAKVTGGFETEGAFKIMQTSGAEAAFEKLFANGGAGFNSTSGFDLSGFGNAFFAEGLKVTISTSEGGLFSIDAQGEASVENQTDLKATLEQKKTETANSMAEDASFLNELARFEGNWQPESNLLLSLIPGNQLSLGFKRVSKSVIESSAVLADGSYSTTSQIDSLISGGNASSKELMLDLASGDKSLSVVLKWHNANRLSATLKSQNNAGELSLLVGQEIFLNRI